jgi:hypothetical protein
MTAMEGHEFVPYHPDWAKPRCKVCREFEDHELHHDDGIGEFMQGQWEDAVTEGRA